MSIGTRVYDCETCKNYFELEPLTYEFYSQGENGNSQGRGRDGKDRDNKDENDRDQKDREDKD